jgi:hypothetical protein
MFGDEDSIASYRSFDVENQTAFMGLVPHFGRRRGRAQRCDHGE